MSSARRDSHSAVVMSVARYWQRLSSVCATVTRPNSRATLANLLTAFMFAAAFAVRADVLQAQVLTVEGPEGAVLSTITPRFTLKLRGISQTGSRPSLYTLFISRSASVEGSFVETIDAATSDTVVNMIVLRLLPNGTPSNPITIFWKARVTLANGTVIESDITGPRQVPLWLKLLSPKDSGSGGGTTENRRLTFVWQSAKLDPSFGPWTYDFQIFTDPPSPGSTVSAAPTDTTFSPPQDLDANKQYKWRVTATVPKTRDQVSVASLGTFSIRDPSVPTATLLYQNFPNPFPTPVSFSTCFWFDIKAGGARVSLDILDLRGSLVKRIVTARDLPAGIHGRGLEGSGSNCDQLYVWNGTDANGLTVPAGIYLARFTATGTQPLFKKIVFRGR